MVLILPVVVVAVGVVLVYVAVHRQPSPLAAGTTPGTQVAPRAHRHAQLSLWMLAAVPLSLILGVILVLVLVGDPNAATAPQRWDNAWRVTVAWAVIVLPAAVGVSFGHRAMKEGDRQGRLGVALNGLVVVVFTVLTLLGGILDGF